MATIENLVAKLEAKTIGFDSGIRSSTNKLKRFANQISRFGSETKRHFNAVSKVLFSLKGAVAALGLSIGAVGLAKSFLDAATTAEGYRIRLNALLGSVKEGSRLFDEMAKFAGRVPFEYREIMGAATQLAGVLEGGVDEITKLMPIIGDLAAVSGLSIQQTTEQIIRMFSAGAASADLFRERGILAMLGFQAGVSVSAEETRKRVIEAWEDVDSKFRGVTKKLAKTWDGAMSMLSDKWFQFRNMIMDAGLFDYIKAMVRVIDKNLGDAIDSSNDKTERWANTTITFIEGTLKGLAKTIEFVNVLRLTIKSVDASISLLWMAIAKGINLFIEGTGELVNLINKPFNLLIDLVNNIKDVASKMLTFISTKITGMINEIIEGINKLVPMLNKLPGVSMEVLPTIQAPDMGKFLKETFNDIPNIPNLNFRSGFLDSFVDTAEQRILDTIADIEAIIASKPGKVVENYLKDVRNEFNKTKDELNKNLAASNIMEKGLKERERALDAFMEQEKKVMTEQKRNLEDQGKYINMSLNDRLNAYQRYLNAQALLMDKTKKNLEDQGIDKTIVKQATAIEEIMGSIEGWGNDMSKSIVESLHGGKDAFKDFANTIIKEIERILIYYKVVKPLMSFVFGPKGLMPIEGYKAANGGIIGAAGHLGIEKMARGGIVTKPTVLAGEGRFNEAIVPLPDGRSIPVQMSGGGGTTVQIIDQRGGGAPPVETQRSKNSSGQEIIRVLIKRELQTLVNNGEMDKTFNTNYTGMRRRPR